MTDLQKKAILDMKRDGLRYSDIALRLKLSVNTVKSFARRSGIMAEIAPMADGACRCKRCGAIYHQPDGQRPKLFCSDKCRVAHWHETLPLSLTAARKFCPTCGRTFPVRGTKKYCSHECYVNHRWLGGGTNEHAV